MELRNIGIALSGGGIRAMIFHLGLFKWLSENKMLKRVKKVSSVSGASLCVGMIYAHNALKWPTNDEFPVVLSSIMNALQTDLQLSAIRKLIFSPNYWNKKVNIIAKVLENKWGVHGNLAQLTGDTSWYVNCTTYETGKRFRFCKENMGDYIVGYVEKPNIPISEVMAASAGFPALIGPYSLKTGNYRWITSTRYPEKKWHFPANQTLHLWDGGVYDNFGLESVFKFNDGGTLENDVDFLIVSNASASIDLQSRKSAMSFKNLKRILDISMDQVAALRSRTVMDFINRTRQGMYVKIGNSAEMIAKASKCPYELKVQLIERCISAEQAIKAMNYATTLRKPAETDIQLLLRHGYEVADCTYTCYQKQKQKG